MSSTSRLQVRDIAPGNLLPEPLEAVPQFNWLFLVELIVCGILVLFFLFYFNRLFATLLSYGIRAYTWHYYRVYVDIHSLQISFLGGRIFFKGFRYHGENETVLVHTGYLTWRYWLRSVKAAGLFRDDEGVPQPSDQETGQSQGSGNGGADGLSDKKNRPPCRIELTLQGLEWFIYNRSAAYESIVEGFPRSDDPHGPSKDGDEATNNEKDPSADISIRNAENPESCSSCLPSETYPSRRKQPSATEYGAKVFSRVFTSRDNISSEAVNSNVDRNETATPKFLTLLPVSVHCTKGAIVIGNENTKSILTATYDKATGEIDVKKAGPLDHYKQNFDFDFSHPVVQMKPNPDFKHSQLAAARATAPGSETPKQYRKRDLHWRYQRHKRRLWHSIRDLMPYFQRSVESFHSNLGDANAPRPAPRTVPSLPGETRWIGLSRYLDEEDQDEHEGWNAVEYGRFSTILDCPRLLATYHWDTPGTVPPDQGNLESSTRRVCQDINGSEPPDWGLHLVIKGGTINYGPWADRERACFQKILFPNPYRNAEPAVPLGPGSPRQSTAFRFTVDIQDDITLRIPTREPSKDWSWKGRADAVKGSAKLKKRRDKEHPRDSEPDKSSHGPDIRPFGWFSLQIDGNSTIEYQMDMVASGSGYQNRLDIRLHGSRMTSSINHGLMWQSGKQTITCDMSNPLEWNSLRTWNFTIKSQGLDLFLLRDHIHLLTDMVSDWTSGSSPDFHVFVPFQYNLKFVFDSFRLFINLNDSNIINNPADTDDNAFLAVKCDSLQSNIGIPILHYRPSRNTVAFDISGTEGLLQLITPLWNTQRTFMKDSSVGSLKRLKLNGSYTYNIGTSPSLTDILTVDIDGDSPQLYLYGFLIRYLLNIKINYFGECQHFKTLDEFQEVLNANEPSSASNDTNPPPKTNDLDVTVHIRGDKPNLLLPANIYGNGDNVTIKAAFLEADVRFTNYYMDLEVFFSPLEAALDSLHSTGSRTTSTPQLFVDGLRIYGHRVFGLPPTEPTYVCNWDFEVGKLLGECTPAFLRCGSAAVRNVGFSIDDEENALPPVRPTILHDVTFVRATVQSINIWALVDDAAIFASTGALKFDFSDWAGSKFSDCLNLNIPDLILAVVDKNSALQQEERNKPTKTLAYFETAVNVKKVERKYDFFALRDLQQQHIRNHDQRSNRTPWLLRTQDQSGGTPGEYHSRTKANPPTMPLPPMPEPVPNIPVQYGYSSRSSSWPDGRATPRYDQSLDDERGREEGTEPFVSEKFSPNFKSTATGKLRRGHDNPPFRLYGTVLDTHLVPSLPSLDNFFTQTGDGAGDVEFSSGIDSTKEAHDYILCELYTGLKGYCSPEAIFILSSLLDGLQPSHPTEVIDALQDDVVTDILRHGKRLSKPKRLLTASLRIPISRVKLISHSTSADESKLQDEYYLELRRVQALYRKRTETKEDCVKPINLGIAIHTSTDSVSFSARGEEVDAFGRKGVLHGKLEDIVLWSASQGPRRSRIQVQNAEITTSNDSVVGLALLFERTSKFIGSITDSFKQTSTNQSKRLHSLVYSLTKSGSQTSDPLFLTRPSYVLRAAGEHLRLNDSWKIVSRFRNIYNSLPKDQKAELTLGCIENTIPSPPDGRSFVLSNFDKWRTWDIAHVKKSYVMKVIWKDPDSSHSQKLDLDAESVSVSLRTLRLSVDSGPKENYLVVEDLWMCIDRNSKPHNYEYSTAPRRPSIYIRSYCSNSFLCLKWEICQLVEDVFKSVSKKPMQSDIYPRNSNSSSSTQKASQSKSQDFQLVFASNTGRIELDGINLKLDMAGDGFKGSIIQQSSGVGTPDTLSIVVASDSSSMAFTSRSSQLMSWQLLCPNIYLSRTSERKGSMTEHDWKCAAACKRLRYDMTEDPIGLIHVADRIVQDEIEYILGVAKSSGSPKPQDTTSEDREIHHFRIAVFLNDYQLRISLLPSVSYLISGEVASVSVSPAPELKVEVDFDIKNNVHALQSDKDGNQRVISSIAGPPINGRILVDPLHNRTSLDIDSTVEVMKVEAGAVRNLLAAINGPEISHFVSDLSHDARILKYRLARVLSLDPLSPPVKKQSQKRELVYKLRLTLAGIEINSTAPGLHNKDYWADLNFNSGMIQVHLDNAPTGGVVLDYPDFQVNLHQVKFGLQKREGDNVQSCGSIVLYARISGTSHINERGEMIRSYRLSSDGLEIELLAETVSMTVDIIAHLQNRLKSIDLSHEIMHLRKIRLIGSQERSRMPQIPVIETPDQLDHKKLFDAMYSVDLSNIQLTWLISGRCNTDVGKDAEDLVFSIKRIELATKRDNAARLRLEDLQLQMIPPCDDKKKRSQNSALLPEAVFNVAYLSTNDERRLAFQAAGKALDIRITSDFILPASLLQSSLASASEKLREANTLWVTNIPSDQKKKEANPNIKRLGSLLIDSDFAGGVVSLQSRHSSRMQTEDAPGQRKNKANSGGKYGQYIPRDAAATARLEAPGVALKVQFEDTGTQNPTLNAELKVDASTNALHPTVVPLITQISSSVREVVGDDESEHGSDKERRPEKALQEKAIGANDPTTILGRCQLNVGLRICRQEFTLSCQPIARVAATACFEDSYITVNTVQSEEKRRFFAVLFAFNSVQASIKHVYSSDSTARCEIDSIVMSLMNSKHVSSSAGISAILKISPTKVYGNVKQAQDFLLFREIWIPPDDPSNPPKAPAASSPEVQAYVVQRYRQMAAAGAFPWDSTFAIEELNVQLDLGQTVGKSDFTIRNLWMSSKKNSDWEQNLCFGFDTVSIENKGRLSGFVELSGVKVRTSIMWPDEEPAENQTPLIQASLGFAQLQAKVSFEYQPFLVADITSFEFLMYNVRQRSENQNDRLVSMLEGDKFQVFCTVLTASQAVALYQTMQRLVQEKQAAYDASLKEIEIFLRRKATPVSEGAQPQTPEPTRKDEPSDNDSDGDEKMPISLHTDVMVNLRAINIGAFPSTFHDNQVFKLEALDADARFTAAADQGRILGGLALTLGQLRVGLSSIHSPGEPATEDLSVSDVVSRATGSRGGTILKVPRVLASMETWQTPTSSQIDYIFKSSFEGRVDVGWNYSRISFIRGMWANHSRALASRLGKPLPQAAVKITGGPKEGEDGEYSGQEKITAVVNVPQSRYVYNALEPPVIETPQLRDMGEATPPLEWIGLHRDKLPNLTHQIIMVTLMEIAKDVEDAYSKILGS